MYEAGVAECYAYEASGPDALRQLVTELGLTPVPTDSTAVVLNGALLRDDLEVAAHCGDRTLTAIQDFRRRAVAIAPARELAPRLRAGRQSAGSWVMLDAFGGCCVYDERTSHDTGSYGVLGWLIAGASSKARYIVGQGR